MALYNKFWVSLADSLQPVSKKDAQALEEELLMSTSPWA